jgi:hypothetical protein
MRREIIVTLPYEGRPSSISDLDAKFDIILKNCFIQELGGGKITFVVDFYTFQPQATTTPVPVARPSRHVVTESFARPTCIKKQGK